MRNSGTRAAPSLGTPPTVKRALLVGVVRYPVVALLTISECVGFLCFQEFFAGSESGGRFVGCHVCVVWQNQQQN